LELEHEIAQFLNYHNVERYHELLNNLTPTTVYFGQHKEVLSARNEIKLRTLE
jgi:hypothetical protein